MEKVSIVRCNSYNENQVYDSIIESFRNINFSFSQNQTVLIKPNLLAQNRPEQYSITHFSIIDALCRILKDFNCKIQIGDSIAFYQKGLTRKAFITSKISEVAKKYNAELIAFDEGKCLKVQDNLSSINELYIPEKFMEADLIVNACKMKSHSGLRLSGAIKNIFGVLPGGYKQKLHLVTKNDFELSDIFINIWMQIKKSVSIMDGIYSLDGGPSAMGKPVFAGIILASVNPAALDVIAGKIIGYKPEEISTLIKAKERGMIDSFDNIETVGGIPLIEFKRLIKGPIPLCKEKEGIFITDTFVNPLIIGSKCNSCGDCARICPVFAITMEDLKIPVINLKKCINCYHCLSICKYKAIKISSSLKNKFIRLSRFILGI